MKEKLSTPKKSLKGLEKENKNKLVCNVKKQKNLVAVVDKINKPYKRGRGTNPAFMYIKAKFIPIPYTNLS